MPTSYTTSWGTTTGFAQGIGPSLFAIGATPICTTRIDISCQNSLDSLATFTGRLGYAWDRILGYAKGGGAWMSGSDRTFDNYLVNGSLVPNLAVGPVCHCVIGSASDCRFGWALGAGLEYAYSSNWSVKMEYLYLGFGSRQQSRSRKFGQDDKWNFCLTTAIIAVNRRNHEQTTPPAPLSGLQGDGGSGRRQGRPHNRPAGGGIPRLPQSDHGMEIAA